MKIRAKTVVLGVLGLLVLVVLLGITAVGWQIVLGPKMRPVTSDKFEATPARLARGQYLVEGPALCFHCHSEPNLSDPMAGAIAATKGAGWQLPIPELGNPYSANITSDAETGIGAWSDDEISRAIREGVDRDGRALFLMPYQNFHNLTDEDVASIVVYLRTLPPVKHAVPKPTWPFPLSILVKTMPKPITSHEPPPARTTPEARGEYLVRTIANCGDCHTPVNDKHEPMLNLEFGGGAPFNDPSQNNKQIVSANITQDASGISHYDEAFFIQTLRTGQLPGRMLSPVMPAAYLKNMTDDDLKDVWAYLKTRPPVKHRVSNTDAPTKCPICGQMHGLGDTNVKTPQ
jgi:mono/diheme cytochrome c family protein